MVFQLYNQKVEFNEKIIVSLLFILYILTYFFSLIYSTDKLYGLHKLKNVSLLVLIIVSLWKSDYIFDNFQSFLNIFLVMVFCSTLWTLYHSMFLWKELSEIYRVGQVLPTTIPYIRFSLILAFSCHICLYLFIKSKSQKQLRILYSTLFIFFFTVIHILAIRSGILGFYLASIVTFALWGIQNKRKLLSLSIVSVFFLLSFIAYKTIPSLNSKVGYTIHNLNISQQNTSDAANYSDPVRITSMKLGLHLIKNNLLFGVGVGDIKKEMDALYITEYPNYPPERYVEPLNQFLYSFATAGLLSFLTLVLTCTYLLVFFARKKNYLMLSFNIILISSFLTECTLEMQYGTVLFTYFNAIGLAFEGNAKNV